MGVWRDDDHGMAIDDTGSIGDTDVPGRGGLGALLRDHPALGPCLSSRSTCRRRAPRDRIRSRRPSPRWSTLRRQRRAHPRAPGRHRRERRLPLPAASRRGTDENDDYEDKNVQSRDLRRTLLRGAAAGVGAAVGLPVLEAMLNGNGNALAGGRRCPSDSASSSGATASSPRTGSRPRGADVAAVAAAHAVRQGEGLHLHRHRHGRLHPVPGARPHGLAAGDHFGRARHTAGRAQLRLRRQDDGPGDRRQDRHDDALQVAAPRRRLDRHQRRRLRRHREVDLAQRPQQPQPARVQSHRALRSGLRRRLLAGRAATTPRLGDHRDAQERSRSRGRRHQGAPDAARSQRPAPARPASAGRARSREAAHGGRACP